MPFKRKITTMRPPKRSTRKVSSRQKSRPAAAASSRKAGAMPR